MEAPRRLPAPNRDELIALGLLDPESPDAVDRERLLQFLMARGATLEELQRSRELADLVSISIDQALRPGPRMTRREVGWRSGTDDDVLVRLRQAMGLSDPGARVAIYTEADVLGAQSFERLALVFGESVALQLIRVAGAAVARIAEAAVSAFMVSVDAPLRAAEHNDVAIGRAFGEVIAALPDFGRTLDVQLRHHIEAAVHQYAMTSNGAFAADSVTITVGFIDIVDSTSWASGLAPSHVAAALQRFAHLAGDVVSQHGGRLVKLIGDEIMFVAADPRDACVIALETIEQCLHYEEFPSVRAGLATGEVIARDGDYHGAVVNLASRLVKCADPGRVVVSRQCASGAATNPNRDVAFRSDGVHYLRGFEEPIELVTLVRRQIRAA